MISQIEQLLTQVTVVIFPFLLYFGIIQKKLKSVIFQRITFTTLCCLTITYLVNHPIHIDSGKILDLRWVPWYISFIYGGPIVGIVVTAFFVVVRILIGGNGMFPAFIIMLLTMGFLIYFWKSYGSLHMRKKILLSTVTVSIMTLLLPIVASLLFKTWEYILSPSIHLYFAFVNMVTMCMVIYIIETIFENDLLYKELIKSEKVLVMSQMAASVAHEVRNPLTSVQGFLQLLNTSPNIDKKEKEYISISLNEVNRANDIIQDYLSIAKVNKKSDSSSNLLEDIAYVRSALSSYANLRNVELTSTITKSVYVRGHNSEIRQVLINFIRNAIESIDNLETGTVTISLEEKNKVVLVYIKDTGKGMTKEQMERLGFPFYTTKDQGTGLGLMLSYKIVKSIGGEVKVRSEVGKGTIFTISFVKQIDQSSTEFES